MSNSISKFMAILKLRSAQAERLGLAHRKLRLKRLWPQSSDHALLEYVSRDRIRIPGQWFSDRGELKAAYQAVEAIGLTGTATAIALPELGLLLQVGGADGKLLGLAELVARPDAVLMSHRPAKRAVVRLNGANLRYAKVVRPKKAKRLAESGMAARNLCAGLFAVPELLALDTARGVTTWSAVPGVPLSDLSGHNWKRIYTSAPNGEQSITSRENQQSPQLNDQELRSAALAAGRALHALHEADPVDISRVNDAKSICSTLNKELEYVRLFAAQYFDRLQALTRPVMADLVQDQATLVPLHGDFRDTHVLINHDGSLGLLDFDELGVGEAASDLAYTLVHQELRLLKNSCRLQQIMTVMKALFEGYQPEASVLRRLSVYIDASRLQFAFRMALQPDKVRFLPSLLKKIGKPILGMR